MASTVHAVDDGSTDVREVHDELGEVSDGVVRADSPSDSAPAGPRRFRVRRASAVLAGLIVVVLVLAAAATALLFEVRADAADRNRNTAVVDAAEEMVLHLTTLKHGSADDDVDRILAGTTGSFRDQFAQQAETFRQVLAQGAVESTGQITGAGLVRADDAAAQVLVAALSTVKNTEDPNGRQRAYRMKVSLQHNDGTWLVSDMEFVS